MIHLTSASRGLPGDYPPGKSTTSEVFSLPDWSSYFVGLSSNAFATCPQARPSIKQVGEPAAAHNHSHLSLREEATQAHTEAHTFRSSRRVQCEQPFSRCSAGSSSSSRGVCSGVDVRKGLARVWFLGKAAAGELPDEQKDKAGDNDEAAHNAAGDSRQREFSFLLSGGADGGLFVEERRLWPRRSPPRRRRGEGGQCRPPRR